ncbi:HNH endonuclease [Providencia rettgeri]
MIIYDNISKLKKHNFIFLGVNDFKKCRFCGKSKVETTFTNISHAIPESVGNKRLVNIDECDLCNNHFAKFETELNKFLSIDRALSKVETKQAISRFLLSNKGGKTHEIVNNSIDKIQGIHLEDNLNVEFDEYSGDIVLHYRKQGFDSLKVYKSLVKMALSIMPVDKISSFSIMKNFIFLEKNDPYLRVNFYSGPMITGSFFLQDCLKIKSIKFLNVYYKESLTVGLIKANRENSDHGFIFYLYVGSICYQILIPSDSFLQDMATAVLFNENKKIIYNNDLDFTLNMSLNLRAYGDIKISFSEIINEFFLNPSDINGSANEVICDFVFCNKKYKTSMGVEHIGSTNIPTKFYTNFGGEKYPFVNWNKLNFLAYFDLVSLDVKVKYITFIAYYEKMRTEHIYLSDVYIVFLFERYILRSNI